MAYVVSVGAAAVPFLSEIASPVLSVAANVYPLLGVAVPLLMTVTLKSEAVVALDKGGMIAPKEALVGESTLRTALMLAVAFVLSVWVEPKADPANRAPPDASTKPGMRINLLMSIGINFPSSRYPPPPMEKKELK